MNRRLIATAASAAYGPSLLALLGSLTLNWPEHPPVQVYDIGLDERTRTALDEAGAAVKAVPSFCPHWRKHYTWKFWCVNDAPAAEVLWLDAGAIALRPLDEVFDAIAAQGYFFVPTYHSLTESASTGACRGCGVPPDFRTGKMAIAAGVAGYRKDGLVGRIVQEALEIALTEEHIAATHPLHRHDQAILSLLAYRELRAPLLFDGLVYSGWRGPSQAPGQAIWVHRRGMRPEDQAHFAAHVSRSGEMYMPSAPADPPVPSVGTRLLRSAGRLRQRSTPKPAIPDGLRD